MFACVNATVTVVGLGATGLSLARYLGKRGADVTVVDGAADPAGLPTLRAQLPGVAFQPCDLTRDTLPASDIVALSPGVPRSLPALKQAIAHGRCVVGDIEIFAQDVSPQARAVAVTGSNGKTTTTALAGQLVQSTLPAARVAGNIGVPILDALDEAPDCPAWVLELSSFQLESTESLRVERAAVLNVTDNHLDRYPSFFAYAASKERLFAHAAAQVLNRDDVWSMSMRRPALPCATFGASMPTQGSDFGLAAARHGRDGSVSLMRGDEVLLPVSQLGVRGQHNALNALAALAITADFAVPLEQQRTVLRRFAGMPHRCQYVGSVDGVAVIDDSKATTVIATSAALAGLAQPTWLIAGGDGKGQAFAELAAAAAPFCRAVHLIGRDAPVIAAALESQGVPYRRYSSLEDAVHAALDAAKSGEQLLLSPACASWDMFRNFGHRADVFLSAVESWARAHGRTLVSAGGSA
ncbi:MAG: UDP-N-acetylmuramoyl-L-alanine--D-glutamate ligase [Burkholderiales bacterium]|nr:UDP-N-acetylmuramoyl-L-alanine--D-glutamate ligase [Burkholderiales bacterium]